MRRSLLAPLPVLAGLLAGCADLDRTASPEAVLVLSASPGTVPANGFSTVTLVAELDPRTSPAYRDVTFTTTLGSFVGAAATTPRSVVIPAASDGRAVATLRSGTEPGNAAVTAEIRDGSVVRATSTLNVPFERAVASSLIALTLDTVTAPADGASITSIVARIDPSFLPQQQTVTFTTTAGSFAPSGTTSAEVRAGADSVARIGLVSPREPATVLVTATVNGFSTRTTVVFEPALPESLSLAVLGSFRLQASFASKVSLRAQLFRSTGTTTRGTEVHWSATDDSTGQEFGYFSAVTPSDIQGSATAEFTPGNTTERGEATIRAWVKGTSAASEVKVEIINPTS